MPLEKAKIIIVKPRKEISVQFNPNEYTISSSVKIHPHKRPGTNAKVLDSQFLGGDLSTFSTSLIFDSYSKIETGLSAKEADGTNLFDVREIIKPFYALLFVSPEKHTTENIKFSWGKFLFEGRLSNFQEHYTMFSEKGIPVKARIEISIIGRVNMGNVASDGTVLEPLCSPDRTKQRTFKDKDSLWAMAYAEYDDPAMWRVIADANGILNPRTVPQNARLKLPAIK